MRVCVRENCRIIPTGQVVAVRWPPNVSINNQSKQKYEKHRFISEVYVVTNMSKSVPSRDEIFPFGTTKLRCFFQTIWG